MSALRALDLMTERVVTVPDGAPPPMPVRRVGGVKGVPERTEPMLPCDRVAP